MNYQTPEAEKLAEMLSMVLGVDATADITSTVDVGALSHVALYINRENEVVASCSCSLATAAALGSALSMIPTSGVKAMIEDNQLSTTATENFYEMMNICSSLLMNDRSKHLRLSEVKIGSDNRIVIEGGKEIVFQVSLGSYGKGCLVFNHG